MKRRDEAERFWSHVEQTDGCWLWQSTMLRNGYGQFETTGSRLAHRVAWRLTFGPIPDGLVVCHSCDVKACVNPAHLHLGTPRSNAQEAVARNRYPVGSEHWTHRTPERVRHGPHLTETYARGERSGHAKLTDDAVLAIQSRAANGESWNSLARAFGITKGNIGHIVSGKTWRHLSPR